MKTVNVVLMVVAITGASFGGCKCTKITVGPDAAIDAGMDNGMRVDSGGGDANTAPADSSSATPADSSAATTTTHAGGGGPFQGTFTCFGGTLTLAQNGSAVTGNYVLKNPELSEVVACTVTAKKCVGTSTTYSHPKGKPAHKGSVIGLTLDLIPTGFEYEQPGYQTYSCKRN